MEKTSYQEKEVSTSNTKRGQYSPRRKDTAPKVNPQLAVELIFQEIKRIEAFTKRIEDATQRKVQIDEKSLENAENSLKSVLSGFEKQSYRMKNGGYVDKRISLWTILCAVFSLLFACLMCYLWVDAAKDRDNYKMYYDSDLPLLNLAKNTSPPARIFREFIKSTPITPPLSSLVTI